MPVTQLSSLLLYRLEHQHESIPAIVAGLSPDEMAVRILTDKWSVRENIAHLACYQPGFIRRIQRILLEDAPSIKRYSAEEDPEFPGWAILPADTLMESLASTRRGIIPLIEGLSAEQLLRKGVHSRLGPLTIPEWTEFFLLHEAHHLFTIFKLAAEQRRKK